MKLSQVTNFLGFTTPKPIVPEVPVQPVAEGEKVVFYSWEALARPHKELLNPKMLKTLIVIAVVVSLILALMQEFVLIIAIASMVFISYALSKTAPELVKHELTNYGVSFAGQNYFWQDLKNFYFAKTGDGSSEILAISSKEVIPGRLFFAFSPVDKEKIQQICAKHLLFLEKEPVSVLDKAYSSVVNKFNF